MAKTTTTHSIVSAPDRACHGLRTHSACPGWPWQRGANENFNGLLRQYFPKGADLSAHTVADLDWVAAEINERPCKRLAFKKSIELIGDLLLR